MEQARALQASPDHRIGELERTGLLADLYQFAMGEAYLAAGMDDTAVFEFYVRRLPEDRNFLVAAGLEPTLCYLEELRFDAEEITALARVGRFEARFLDWLADFRFAGDVHAVPEGTIVFANEPLVRVTAPIAQAQLVESRVVNLMHFSTIVASKAARCTIAANGRSLVDFGMRRAHGAEAALHAARACWIAGFDGTATVLAGVRYGIPVVGTMAHAYVQAHPSEQAAFESFARARPHGVTLLLDTYDTEAAAAKVVALAPRLRADGATLAAVRLDSGDLARHAAAVRAILDRGSLADVRIVCSGGLDEKRVDALVRGGAPIDVFGVGTALDTSADAPALDCAYKLQAYAGRPRRKRSEGKANWPGAKQAYRLRAADGLYSRDVVTTADDPQYGEPLLVPVMRAGRRLHPAETLEAMRRRARRALADLPASLRALEAAAAPYPVEIAPALVRLAAEVDAVPV